MLNILPYLSAKLSFRGYTTDLTGQAHINVTIAAVPRGPGSHYGFDDGNPTVLPVWDSMVCFSCSSIPPMRLTLVLWFDRARSCEQYIHRKRFLSSIQLLVFWPNDFQRMF